MVHPTQIALVVAVADNGVIGQAGKLPWHLPDDLKHFKQVTLGKPVLMGRRTFDSIGRALPGRRNLVLTRSTQFVAEATQAVRSVDDALALVKGVAQLCVIGGSELFELALPRAECVYLTRVHAAVPGDTCFPLKAVAGWRESERVEHPQDARHAYAMSFVTLLRD